MGCFSCFPKEKRQGIESGTQGKKRSMNCFPCFSSEESTERKKRNMNCFSCFQAREAPQGKTQKANCFSCFQTQKSTQAKKDATQERTPKMGCFSCFPKKKSIQEKTPNTNCFPCFTAKVNEESAEIKKQNTKCFSCFPRHEKKDSMQGKKRNRSYLSCFPTQVKKDSTQGKRRNMIRFPCFATRWKRRTNRLRRFGQCHCLPFPFKNKNKDSGELQGRDVSPKRAKKVKVNIKDQDNKNLSAKIFTFKELATATKNFKEECILGEGGFGRVYKGKLEKTGKVVAIKQLNPEGKQGNKEFLAEVMMLSHLSHPHLVNLVGYCADGEQRLLVYEYMRAGSLENHLLDLPCGKRPLNWSTRMKVALHAAKGLEYLHETNNPPIIYRDLKSSNILLDKDFNAKLSDFGLARIGPVGEKTHVSSRVMGTFGYCAPEYQKTGRLTVKSDIYSYGVVLLELITGRRAVDLTRDTEELHLVQWVEPKIRDPHKYAQVVDPMLQGKYPQSDLSQVLAIAAMCLGVNAPLRPPMSDVVAVLDSLVQDAHNNPTAI
ncbi:unnamed protein product [Lactuca virosa]|uniref:Protein kinase domain-containing protein n=1 Tax=Lactuca virosa TaxID=75947 RepID=A0AAU9PVY1_9ASTR|nr:unnamed protein product [Lactuca virosa]